MLEKSQKNLSVPLCLLSGGAHHQKVVQVDYHSEVELGATNLGDVQGERLEPLWAPRPPERATTVLVKVSLPTKLEEPLVLRMKRDM